MTEREARIAAIRVRWRKATTDGPANEFLGEAWNDIPWLLAHLQAAERDRDAAQRGLACALRWLRDNDCGDVADVIEADFTPTPPPEEDAR